MARVLVLLTGGTLLMSARAADDAGRGAITLGEQTGRDLLAEVPSLTRVADLETRLLFNMDSADMGPSHWITLARAVHAALESYDGIVVVHGTDSMAYSASALGLLLGPLSKPVVLTGAQRPLIEPRTDARQNLIDATLVATMDVPEVSVVMGAMALRGVRSTKRDAWGFEAFDSPSCAPLVRLGIGVERAPHVRAAAASVAPFDDRIEPRVLAVRVFPGLDPALIKGAVRAGVRGLVLEAYGSGNLPDSHDLIEALEEARARDVPVVVVSQCLKGYVDFGRYDGGARAREAGAISGGDMTVEAALAKLMIGLGRHGPGAALRAYIARDEVGERQAATDA